MKQNASPLIIAIAVIVLVGVMFGLYKMTFGPAANNVKAENKPAYMQSGGPPSYGQGAAYGGQPGQGFQGMTRPGTYPGR